MENSIFEDEYIKVCSQESDIHEHLPILRDLAKGVSHVTEMGVREGISTRSFLTENVILRSYDLYLSDSVNQLFEIARGQRKNVQYIQANVLDIEIEETDLLFIDTWHCYEQLVQELNIHSVKVKKYIAFHDTQTYGTCSENFQGRSGSNGLLPAIIEFVINNPEWKFKLHKTNNNGLTVIERV